MKIVEEALTILRRRGEKSLKLAAEIIVNEEIISYSPLRKALHYFLQEIRFGAPHSALISLACEAVGGNPDDTSLIGAAMVLLAGAADIHDDIIDNSTVKNSKPTVLGKFGRDLALLAGDALLFKGLTVLFESCKKLPMEKGERILKLVENAFFDLGIAEAKEASFKGNLEVSPREYLDVIKGKTSIVEMYARIGAIIGGGTLQEENALGKYGRTLGFLTTLRDDFIDIYDPDELKNRLTNECLPLPLLYALQEPKIKSRIMPILTKDITEESCLEIVGIVESVKDVQKLRRNMRTYVREALKLCSFVHFPHIQQELKLLLLAAIESI
ncbi:MAG: polyprenyl synthetase family protein [Candidatus Aenigmatarchaeota archaeon]